MHYLRWKRHGDPLYTLPVTSGCPVDGCDRPSESWPASRRALVVDHLDFDGLNNDPANLVPSCHPCNAGRTRRWEDDHAAPAKAS